MQYHIFFSHYIDNFCFLYMWKYAPYSDNVKQCKVYSGTV